MRLTMLGTGNALVTKCYNTCFILEEGRQYFLVDGGGGNTLLAQLEKANVYWGDIHHIFVTHRHIDHILGIVWMMRMITQHMKKGTYSGEAYIYAYSELIPLLRNLADTLLQPKECTYIDTQLHLVPVADGEKKKIIGHQVQFFDIHSTKATQYGFTIDLGVGEHLTCCGDEPYNDCEKPYATDSKWLLHEAFCLYGESDLFHPYEKHHSTVREACQLAQKLHVENLVLYHTEDSHIANRRELYTAEGAQYYTGRLWVPEDLESIEL